MRDVDSEPIQREIDKIRHIHSKEINAFQEAEEWRRKFLESEENEIEHILEEFYSAQSNDLSANPSMEELRETAIRARKQMRGSGNKTGSINYPRKLFQDDKSDNEQSRLNGKAKKLFVIRILLSIFSSLFMLMSIFTLPL